VLHTDLNPLKGESVAEGVHLGAMDGSLDILQRRYLDISATVDGQVLDPAVSAELGKVSLRIRYRGETLHVESHGKILNVVSDASNRNAIVLLCQGARKCLEPGESIQVTAIGEGISQR
jgi:trehalose/maltose hydrolase-like predicted phosphorylase